MYKNICRTVISGKELNLNKQIAEFRFSILCQYFTQIFAKFNSRSWKQISQFNIFNTAWETGLTQKPATSKAFQKILWTKMHHLITISWNRPSILFQLPRQSEQHPWLCQIPLDTQTTCAWSPETKDFVKPQAKNLWNVVTLELTVGAQPKPSHRCWQTRSFRSFQPLHANFIWQN